MDGATGNLEPSEPAWEPLGALLGDIVPGEEQQQMLAPVLSTPFTNTLDASTTTASNEVIRKPKNRACDICHRRKVKCDNVQPACSQCVKFRAQCTYNSILGPRKKITRSRPKRTTELEKRINQLENALLRGPRSESFPGRETCHSILAEGTQPPSNAHTGSISAPFHNASYETTGDSASTTIYDVTPVLDIKMQCWVPEPYRIPSYSFQQHRELENMVRRSEVMPLLQAYFDTFNRAIPLFDQASFMQRFCLLDMKQVHSDAVMWTAMSVMCALAHRYRAIMSQAGDNDREAWRHLQAALGKVVELTICGPQDMLAIQALLGMAIVLQSTPDPSPALTLVAAAVRLVHRDNLHIQRQHSQTMGFAGCEDHGSIVSDSMDTIGRQRNRIFWIAYSLDLDLSFRLGRPPLIHEDDIDVPLPPNHPNDWLGFIWTTDGTVSINYFRLRAQLALIQGRIHQRLYTLRAARQPDHVRHQAIQELDMELRQWMASSGGLDSMLETHLESLDLSVVFSEPSVFVLRLLYLTYLSCHAKIHSLSFQRLRSQGLPSLGLTSSTSLSDQFPSCSPVGSSVGPTDCCITAARISLLLLQLHISTDHACTWTILNHYVSAVAILLVHAASKPQDSRSLHDLSLTMPVLGMLQRFEAMSTTGDTICARRICTKMVSNARHLIINSL